MVRLYWQNCRVKKRIIAETGAGRALVSATATIAARLGLECVVFHGVQNDVKRQAMNVYRYAFTRVRPLFLWKVALKH